MYNVSASHRNFTLQHLSPGQKYGVWIRAVSAIGTGENATLTFETKHGEEFGIAPHLTSLLVYCDELKMNCMIMSF